MFWPSTAFYDFSSKKPKQKRDRTDGLTWPSKNKNQLRRSFSNFNFDHHIYLCQMSSTMSNEEEVQDIEMKKKKKPGIVYLSSIPHGCFEFPNSKS